MENDQTQERKQRGRVVRPLNELVKEVSKRTGISEYLVNRIIGCYWSHVIEELTAKKVVKVCYKEIYLHVVSALAAFNRPHEYRHRRLRLQCEHPIYGKRYYKVRVRSRVMGMWINMQKKGHQFFKL